MEWPAPGECGRPADLTPFAARQSLAGRKTHVIDEPERDGR